MPRVYLSEEERLLAKLTSWVYGEMKIQGLSQRQLAEEMNVSQQLLSYKLKNQSFTFKDFLGLVKALKPDTEEILRLVGSKGE